ncbi:histone-lysine N-methyltransferase Suv4-20 [Drosophila rhopaloa]|uniref:Uncharacterized protein n=1 Tax=Drosophila rhopaloa TaxID=1041015 RepID=A0ABM5I6Q8_DRORH|nr:histone-lysine N-methyltransferase Suv4-20 [Drosophila rhopaloa]
MPGPGVPRPNILQQDQDQDRGSSGNVAHLWASVIEKLNRVPGKQLRRSGDKCVKCQTSESITNSISNATGSGGESESANESAQVQGAVNSGSAILCSVNSANNTRKLNLILSKSQQRGEQFVVGTNLQNKLPASSADCHLSPSAETNIRTTPPRSPPSTPCPYSHRHRHRHRHPQHHHHHYRHRGCRCRCRDASQSASASASPASMVLPYQINQRATLLQQSAAATSTTLPHVPGATATTTATATSLRTVPRIFKRKRDTVQTATTASPLTPQQHPTVAAVTSTTSSTSTTTTRRSRLEFILYTEVYEVEEDSVSPGDFHSKSNVGSNESFRQKYGE